MEFVFLVILAGSIQITMAASGVRGTHWTDTSGPGAACQLPKGSYSVTHGLALGQGNALGGLKFRPGMCGNVLDVSCGGSSIQAVVVDQCDIGSGNCGVDMLTDLWNQATGNKPFGEVQCEVTLANVSPFESGNPTCYHRIGSATGEYSRILGVVNTGGQVVQSATLAGTQGRFSNGGWLEFNSGGKPLFVNSADVVFTYESGGSATFKLSDCREPGGVQDFI